MRDCGYEYGSVLCIFELVIVKISNLGLCIFCKCSYVLDESWCLWCLFFVMVMDILFWEMCFLILVVLVGFVSLCVSFFDDIVVLYEFF